ncbi:MULTISPECIES: glycosyltransferase family 2 protein [unclassified Kaistella]|uniref:glycosyltransferase family 2 protein n=1 Tax=unclassified Kaistella TaxID=2762626 RepID=UPI002735B3FF|nr:MULTISPECIES: glycosyltransferase family 2 protein [unclassified Kaistella]MDP2452513.1 glycosyltransferase family 2 protein [Kaistella sp. SH11-4b]MDP2455421.1 glycosyltransferase family 2 protein [Kaistella sp. SH40-3]MDP2458325.1 glycosyltransferase family 2 protein [Kaistella sp. SH19-2b]
MEGKPVFSIIIPVFNVEKYIKECLDSVINQKFNDFEVILVNDGSTDKSASICETYKLIDPRINVIQQNNRGLSDARNTGILVAKGLFLLFLDSDDYWNDNAFLGNLAKIIGSNPETDVINFGWTKYFQFKQQFVEDTRDYSILQVIVMKPSDIIPSMIENDLFIASACNKCIRKEFVMKNQLFFKKGIRSEDMEWCGNILYLMPRMTCYNSKAYIYRQQRIDSITATVDKAHVQDIITMIKNAMVLSHILSADKRKIYMSYFAVQYLTLLYNVCSKKLRADRQIYKETYDLRNILKYDLNKKVKVVRKVNAILGFRLTSMLLYYYVK